MLDRVTSIRSLVDRLKRQRTDRAAAGAVAAVSASVAPQRTAVFVIHGISPIQRYAIQDRFADGLFGYLNFRGGEWARAVHWPKNSAGAAITPSAIRIYDRADGASPETSKATFDIFEGYWSPLTKGKTTIASLLQWLLTITFLATSSTADLPSDSKKLRWDAGYLGALLLIFGILCGASIVLAAISWRAFTRLQGDTGDSPTTIASFISAALKMKPFAYIELALFVILGYCVAQLFSIWRVRSAENVRRQSIAEDAVQDGTLKEKLISATAWHRWTARLFVSITIATLLVAVGIGAWESARGNVGARRLVVFAALVVVTFAAAQTARYFADFVVENVLGDIQVYTTHDTNAQFFAIRNQIIDTITSGLLGVLKAYDADENPLYEAIHVAAHSLGTTVGLDVLMRLRMLVEEGSVDETEFDRIESFVTFGTSLEKTRFFFDVTKPTMSAAHDQWDADVYGRFFDDKPSTQAIYWHNIWYFRDIVANEIVSYESDVSPNTTDFIWGATPRQICSNTKLEQSRPPWAFVHGDYLSDAAFWEIAGDIVTRVPRILAPPPPKPPPPQPRPLP